MADGILVVNKPSGMTSRDIVNQANKIFATKKIGHTGTLDPLASGILVLGIGNGTKIIDLLTNQEKEYIAEAVIGVLTDTLDITGNILRKEKKQIPTKQIEETLHSFLGEYDQEVPLYSAIHVQGKRLYEYARNQETQNLILPKRRVNILAIKLLEEPHFDQEGQEHFKFSVKVSKGTYIRSLIRDIGLKLGTDCTMTNLIRTKQGGFTLAQAVILSLDTPKPKLLKIEEVLDEYDRIVVEDDMREKILNGCLLDKMYQTKYGLFFDRNNQLLAIYQDYPKIKGKVKPYRVFNH
ncbi:MAG TPA: tRNA pseudouridine(55) synthase TruB [Candidatus Scybalousia intestinigallinarum]|nr:tRNA pseudouridine(55) synthase TruB [Candidatus Scybalousia intestinigallinarum]